MNTNMDPILIELEKFREIFSQKLDQQSLKDLSREMMTYVIDSMCFQSLISEKENNYLNILPQIIQTLDKLLFQITPALNACEAIIPKANISKLYKVSITPNFALRLIGLDDPTEFYEYNTVKQIFNESNIQYVLSIIGAIDNDILRSRFYLEDLVIPICNVAQRLIAAANNVLPERLPSSAEKYTVKCMKALAYEIHKCIGVIRDIQLTKHTNDWLNILWYHKYITWNKKVCDWEETLLPTFRAETYVVFGNEVYPFIDANITPTSIINIIQDCKKDRNNYLYQLEQKNTVPDSSKLTVPDSCNLYNDEDDRPLVVVTKLGAIARIELDNKIILHSRDLECGYGKAFQFIWKNIVDGNTTFHINDYMDFTDNKYYPHLVSGHFKYLEKRFNEAGYKGILVSSQNKIEKGSWKILVHRKK